MKLTIFSKSVDVNLSFEKLTAALSINNNFKYAKLGLGRIYKSKGNFREAKKTFQKIIDSDGNEIKSYYEITDFLDDKEIKKNIKNLEILEKNNKQKYKNKDHLQKCIETGSDIFDRKVKKKKKQNTV